MDAEAAAEDADVEFVELHDNKVQMGVAAAGDAAGGPGARLGPGVPASWAQIANGLDDAVGDDLHTAIEAAVARAMPDADVEEVLGSQLSREWQGWQEMQAQLLANEAGLNNGGEDDSEAILEQYVHRSFKIISENQDVPKPAQVGRGVYPSRCNA